MAFVTEHNVTNNKPHHRFEIEVDGRLSLADYHIANGVMTFTHTEVPPELEGRGLASQLIKAGLAFAREHGFKVVPQCSFVAAYIKRHPEYQTLLA
jgi:hypothetical protein